MSLIYCGCVTVFRCLNIVWLIPLPSPNLIVSCLIKIHNRFTFPVPACPGCSGKVSVKWVLSVTVSRCRSECIFGGHGQGDHLTTVRTTCLPPADSRCIEGSGHGTFVVRRRPPSLCARCALRPSTARRTRTLTEARRLRQKQQSKLLLLLFFMQRLTRRVSVVRMTNHRRDYCNNWLLDRASYTALSRCLQLLEHTHTPI